MRFTVNGPEIPRELRKACADGNAIFFCGAGVSQSAHMPGFKKLTNKLIERLSPDPDSKITKLISFYHNPTHVKAGIPVPYADLYQELYDEFGEAQVENEMSAILKANESNDPSRHRLLCQLSENDNGPQIITTNADNLFQQIHTDGYEPPNLPTADFNGIVYLHGKWKKPDEGFERKNYIFSSADFGRAYLSEGWATRFIKNLLLSGKSIVFIGYSADDPPIKFLLQALHTDGKKHPLYAFASFTPGTQTPERIQQEWFNKGVHVMPYPDIDDHSALWNSIQAWNQMKHEPDSWESAMVKMVKKGPNALEPFQLEQVKEWLNSYEGRDHFNQSEPAPSVAWLPELTDQIEHLLLWFSKIMDNPGTALWAVKEENLPSELLDHIHWLIKYRKRDIAPEAASVWKLIVQSFGSNGADLSGECSDVCHNIVKPEHHHEATTVLRKCLAPKLKAKEPFQFFTKPDNTLNWNRTGDIVRLSVAFPFHRSHLNDLDVEAIKAPDLLHSVFSVFKNALEQSINLLNQLPEQYCNWQVSDLTGSGEQHENKELECIWKQTGDLFKKLSQVAPEKAQAEVIIWPEDEPFFFNKLQLYAWSLPAFTNDQAIAGLLRTLGHSWNNTNLSTQWIKTAQARWKSFNLVDQNKLEEMISTIFDPKTATTEESYIQWLHAKDFWSNLMNSDIPFSESARQTMSIDIPDQLKPISQKSKDDFLDACKQLGIRELPRLNNVDIHRYKQWVKQSATEAFQWLQSQSHSGDEESQIQFWATLALHHKSDDSPEDRRQIAEAFFALSASAQLKLAVYIPRWLREHLPIHAKTNRTEALQWWDDYFHLLAKQPDTFHEKQYLDGHDEYSTSSAIHLSCTPLYMMIDALLMINGDNTVRLEAALQQNKHVQKPIICAMSYHLTSLHEANSIWTAEKLIPHFSGEHQEAAWSGFCQRTNFYNQCSDELCEQLLPHFQEAASHCQEWNWPHSSATCFARFFSRTILRDLILEKEMKEKGTTNNFLRNLGSEGQCEIINRLSVRDLFTLEIMTPLFAEWPKEKRFKTEELSGALVNALMFTKDSFQQLLKMTLPFLTPIRSPNFQRTETYIADFPQECLQMLDRIVPASLDSKFNPDYIRKILEQLGRQHPTLKKQRSFRRLQSILLNHQSLPQS
jgi:hypothetical protein